MKDIFDLRECYDCNKIVDGYHKCPFVTNRVIIAGSRTFDNYVLLKWKVNQFLSGLDNIEIISGCASGADRLGERYAKEMGYPVKLFPANWNEMGTLAGPFRNRQMARYASEEGNGYLIAFWDQRSSGTRSMIERAEQYGLEVKVVYF